MSGYSADFPPEALAEQRDIVISHLRSGWLHFHLVVGNGSRGARWYLIEHPLKTYELCGTDRCLLVQWESEVEEEPDAD